ncbi:MAG: hypothetical protein HOH48_01505 [Candidatus Puniceispirillum sp.]|nr:hypothetical protein [Candidatus Puniceispirillum sp.]
MVRHGKAPDPKADMMYPDGLGRVISGELFLAQVILAQVISGLVILGRVIHRIRRASPPCYQLSSQ